MNKYQAAQAIVANERRTEAKRLKDAGLTFKQIGEQLGVTKERARQMLISLKRTTSQLASRAQSMETKPSVCLQNPPVTTLKKESKDNKMIGKTSELLERMTVHEDAPDIAEELERIAEDTSLSHAIRLSLRDAAIHINSEHELCVEMGRKIKALERKIANTGESRSGQRSAAQKTKSDSLPATGAQLIRLPEVEDMTGLRKSTIYTHMAKKEHAFPAPVRIGDRAVAWRKSDILDWMANRPDMEPQT